ncbi:MAG: class I fructose-bisphosphate aldolase [Nitrospinota bacterium]|nr:class I fructose-bisphosphate aldolase [Nitrospinota bacterium]
MDQKVLITTANQMVSSGRGILAADESSGTIKKRLDNINVESTEENRRDYRELLFTTKGIENYISGVILFDETIRQSSSNNVPFPELLSTKGIVPGIKVDMGAKDLALSHGEKITEGLDGLRERLLEYVQLGAKFTKWRAVIEIKDGGLPSQLCIELNAHALARYAALSQESGLVPIVEPEVLMDGKHTIDHCKEVTERTLKTVFHELFKQNILLEGMVLKPNMVISGSDCAEQADSNEIAAKTVGTLLRCVPSSVPGITFLSGGQTDTFATQNLNAMNALDSHPHPWELSFSYGRALQAACLKAWNGNSDNLENAQKVFSHRCKCNSAARDGSYSEKTEQEISAA